MQLLYNSGGGSRSSNSGSGGVDTSNRNGCGDRNSSDVIVLKVMKVVAKME